MTNKPVDSFARPQYQDVERKPLLKLVPSNAERILDIGCNRGGFGRSIKAMRNAEIWGIEPDPDSAAAALRPKPETALHQEASSE
jgi:predicted RNA methylase